jgi:hypothetical protein
VFNTASLSGPRLGSTVTLFGTHARASHRAPHVAQ